MEPNLLVSEVGLQLLRESEYFGLQAKWTTFGAFQFFLHCYIVVGPMEDAPGLAH